MTWTNKQPKTVNGLPLPQKYNPVTDDHIASVGEEDIQNGFSVNSLTVGTTAVELKAGDTALAKRRKVIFRVSGDDAIFIGHDSSVTTTTGYPVLPGETFKVRFDPSKAIPIYAIAASDQTVKIMETN
ncbi:hypothetical protein [Alkalihalobacillus sp. BA299]|uniref:hypothetical protein n=1 Tax=Alkalihalobacillus sp. BA299 TaxID=2815938 RepID=UPI001ADC4D80|nr:hypothetical protein [Alkalihalobacillus sp. BA299]